MAKFKELGIIEGEVVRYHPTFPMANWGPSYAPESHEAEVVKIDGNAVYVYPPHRYNRDTWQIQNKLTGEIEGRAKRTVLKDVKGAVARELKPLDHAVQRYVDVLNGDDKYRFLPRTRRQFLRTALIDGIRSVFRATDTDGRHVGK